MMRGALRRLIPQSLLGRLTVLLLLALLVSQAAGGAAFMFERWRALVTEGARQTAERTAAVRRLLEKAPEDLHADITAAAGGFRLRFDASDTPWAGAEKGRGGGFAEGLLRRRLIDELGPGMADKIRVRADWRNHWEWDRRRRHGRDDEDEWLEWLDDGDDGDDDDDAWLGWVEEFAPPGVADRIRAHTEGRGGRWDGRWDGHWDGQRGGAWRGHFAVISVPLSNGGWLNVRAGFEDRPFNWRGPVQISAALMALAILAAVWIFVRRALRPVGALAEASERLGRGEPVAPLEETGPPDIRRTVRAFNTMSARIERFVRDRTELLAAVSHDLRTPITAMRLRAALLEDGETKTRMEAALDELQAMVESLLAYARTEAEQEPARTADLVSLVRAAAAVAADSQGLDARAMPLRAPDTLALRCRPEALKRCIGNILQNAAQYAGGWEISILADADNENVTVRIEDNGPGVPEDRLAGITAPFVRLDKSRSRETGGVGLGLSIAQGIARAHGGDLKLSNRAEGGLRADIILPAGTA